MRHDTVKAFCMDHHRSFPATLWQDFIDSFRVISGCFMRRKWCWLASTSVLTLAIIQLVPLDAWVVTQLGAVNSADHAATEMARHISFFGDFLGFNTALFTGLSLAGWWRSSRRLQRLAVASLVCAMCAGATANTLRTLTGRPRPYVHDTDRLTGPNLSTAYQSLPSAHSATAFGGALPVLLSCPQIGVPASLFASAVGWSRLQLNRHHLTDVLASAAIALLFSVPLSRWALHGSVVIDSKASSSAHVIVV